MSKGLIKALQEAFQPVRDDLMDDLVAKLGKVKGSDPLAIRLDKNVKAATKVVELAKKLDGELCMVCGPNKVRLQQLRSRLQAAQQVS